MQLRQQRLTYEVNCNVWVQHNAAADQPDSLLLLHVPVHQPRRRLSTAPRPVWPVGSSRGLDWVVCFRRSMICTRAGAPWRVRLLRPDTEPSLNEPCRSESPENTGHSGRAACPFATGCVLPQRHVQVGVSVQTCNACPPPFPPPQPIRMLGSIAWSLCLPQLRRFSRVFEHLSRFAEPCRCRQMLVSIIR